MSLPYISILMIMVNVVSDDIQKNIPTQDDIKRTHLDDIEKVEDLGIIYLFY